MMPVGKYNEEQDSLSQVEGLDLDLGLKHAANNLKLYTMLLKAFCANNCNAAEDLRSFLLSEDFTAAGRRAHSLKGVAITIGARPLHEAARALEQAICDHQLNRVEEELIRIEQMIEPLLRQLNKAFDQGKK